MCKEKGQKTSSTNTTKNTDTPGFGTYFTSKKGIKYYAKDYGYKVWPFGKRKKVA